MVGDGLGHLSKDTRKRAFVLARNAKSVGIPLGNVRFSPSHDYMSYYLTNSSSYIIIFCTPLGYLVEMWAEGPKGALIEPSYFGIRNIRHFLQRIKKDGYEDIDVIFDDEDFELRDTDTDELDH